METAKNLTEQATNTIGNALNPTNISNATNNVVQGATNTLNSIKTNIAESVGQFNQASVVNAGNDFLSSNTIIAKFMFIILVVILFFVALTLGTMLISWIYRPSKSVMVVNGLVSGSSDITVSQDPKKNDSATLLLSNNENKGLEFTWSMWLFIDSLGEIATPLPFNHVFNKGSVPNVNTSAEINGPGVYIQRMNDGYAKLVVLMDTPNRKTQSYDAKNMLEIEKIPINKWMHVAVRMQGTNMDVYVNGTVSGHKDFEEIVRQNFHDVHVGKNGGFGGKLSNLAYYSRGLSVFEINNIVYRGPNLTESSRVQSNIGNYSYISSIWYGNKLQ